MPTHKTINVSPDLHALIQQIAKDEERSMSSVVRRAISSYSSNEGKPLQEKTFQKNEVIARIEKKILAPQPKSAFVNPPETEDMGEPDFDPWRIPEAEYDGTE